jgi:iron(III) transport system substrate-binding protein
VKKSYLAASIVAAVLVVGSLTWVTTQSESAGEKVEELTIYSGRSEEFIAPFFDRWEQESGITLNVRYGDSAELAAQILEEGQNSPADLFLSQDAGSLGAVSVAGLFAELPSSVGQLIESKYIAQDRSWIGVTGRVRVFAYNPEEVRTLPTSITDLTKSIYRGKIGIAPSNASFQAFVTALINEKGEAFAQKWLTDLKENDAKIYLKNSAIVEAIDQGEIDLGLVNHYYLWEVSTALGREIKVKNGYFNSGDIGNLVNVSGAGVLATSTKQKTAQELIKFLTSQSIQELFVKQTHEFSLIPGTRSPQDLPDLKSLGTPLVDLGELVNIQRTQDLLIKVGLL